MKNIWKVYNENRNRTLEYLGFRPLKIKGVMRYFDHSKTEVYASPLLYKETSDSEFIMVRRFKDKDFYEIYDLDGKFLKIIEKITL